MNRGARTRLSTLITENFHALIVSVALAMNGLLLLYNGTIDLPAIDQYDQNWILGTCLVGGIASLVLAVLTVAGPLHSQNGLDRAMTLGLLAAVICNAVSGTVWPESMWIACGYTMIILMVASLTLRHDYLFALVVVLATASWVAVSVTADPRMMFFGAANTMVGVTAVVSAAMFAALRVERHLHQGLTGELRSQADHDPLTGSLNRNGLLSGLPTLQSLSTDGAVWCAYLDVDYFKTINDRRGHDHGDEVLKAIVRQMDRVVGPAGLIARWGGDEFVVIGNGVAPTAGFLEQQVDAGLATHGIEASVSVGVTASRWSPEIDIPALIELADIEMYARRDLDRASSESPAPLS